MTGSLTIPQMTPDQFILSLLSSEELAKQLGPWLLGALCECNLAGILFGQVMNYFRTFGSSDPLSTRVLIGLLVLFNLLQDVETYAITFLKFVSHFGSISWFLKFTWTQWTQPPTTAAITGLVQIFFALRAWKCVNRQKWFAIVIVPLILAAFVIGVVTGVRTRLLANAAQALAIQPWITSWLSITITGDLVITFVLIRYLLMLDRDVHDTRTMITRLIALTMETMTPPLLCAIANLAVFSIFPLGSYEVFFAGIQGKLYTHALFHTLNARSELRATNPRVIATLSSSKPSSRRAQTPSSSAQAKGVRGMNISIVGATSTLPVQGNWTALGGSEIELETGLRSVRGTEEDHLADDRKEMDFQSPDLENCPWKPSYEAPSPPHQGPLSEGVVLTSTQSNANEAVVHHADDDRWNHSRAPRFTSTTSANEFGSSTSNLDSPPPSRWQPPAEARSRARVNW